MRSFAVLFALFIALLLLSAPAGAVCTGPQPVVPPDPPPPVSLPDAPPTNRPPPLTAGPPPDGPLTPGTAPTGPFSGRPSRPDPRSGVPGLRPRPRGVFGQAGSWLVWWELNREYLVGLKKTLPSREVASGGEDPMPGHRKEVRAALLKVIEESRDDGLRAVALTALGRAGQGRDSRLFLTLLQSRTEAKVVREAAAIGLGNLPTIEDARYREEVRRVYSALLMKGLGLGPRGRQIAILALAMRAREDAAIVRSLGVRLTKDPGTVNDAAALLLACGLARDEMLGGALIRIVESGKCGGKKLDDVARSHAVLALPLCAGADAVPVLTGLLAHPKTGVHTRRSATLALGKLLAERGLERPLLESARKRILTTFDKDRDLLVKGYAAVAMGAAREPFGVTTLVRKIERDSCMVVRPYAAIALGLATPRLEEQQAKKVRAFLVTHLRKEKGLDLSAALAVAVGLSGAEEGRKLLLVRAGPGTKNPDARAPACQALGLLGPDAESEKLLTAALDDPSEAVVEKAAIGLGMIGGRSSVRAIVEKLVSSKSERLQGHLVIALSHLGGTPAIGPLADVVTDPGRRVKVRQSAAAALGVLVDPRATDPMFEYDALVNPYALTTATRELMRVW